MCEYGCESDRDNVSKSVKDYGKGESVNDGWSVRIWKMGIECQSVKDGWGESVSVSNKDGEGLNVK